MSSSQEKGIGLSKEDYNLIPVYYCKQCLSLRIKSVPGMHGMEYCDICNSTNIDKANIYIWEKLFAEKYGYRYLDEPKYK